MLSSQREKILLVGLFLLIIGFYFLYFYPGLSSETEKLNREIALASTNIDLARERIDQIPELKEELQELIEMKEKILALRIFEPEEMLVDLMAVIAGVDLEPVGYQPSLEEEGFFLTFLLRGDYYSMLELINILEDLDPRLEITVFEINSQADDLQMNIELFYHKIEEEEG